MAKKQINNRTPIKTVGELLNWAEIYGGNALFKDGFGQIWRIKKEND